MLEFLLSLFCMTTIPPQTNIEYEFSVPYAEVVYIDEFEVKAEITAYSLENSTGIAYDGTPAIPNKTIAVDPKTIPLSSMVYIPTQGWRRANDTGSGVKTKPNGVTVIDLCVTDFDTACDWGRRTMTVRVRPPKARVKFAIKETKPNNKKWGNPFEEEEWTYKKN